MPKFADIILHDASVVDPGSGCTADSVAVTGERFTEVGDRSALRHLVGPETRMISCKNCSILPGLIDGHAHMDREGLKSILPSLADARCIGDILEIIAREAAAREPGEWIVTMPIGAPPLFLDGASSLREKRYPNRKDLDKAAPNNPVFIRPVWGYWSNQPPLVSIANSLALRLAGIDGRTKAPSAEIEIERDGKTGEPTGIFREHTRMSIVELTLMSAAPNFRPAERVEALEVSMKIYNACGTTAVYEGHGVASDVIAAYQAVRDSGKQSVRATLVLSPSWSSARGAEDVHRMLRDWAGWAGRRGFGDGWLRIEGVYAEQDESLEGRLRAQAAPQTSWAGFNYDAGLPKALLRELLLEAARNSMRVSTIFPEVAGLFGQINSEVPVDHLRWVRGHISIMDQDAIEEAKDLGLVLVSHTNRHISKMGSKHLERLGEAGMNDIVPLRRLRDRGIPVALGSDNLPPSLFKPITDAVFRRDRTTGCVVAPAQALSRQEAFASASQDGAWLLGREHELGRISKGFLADLIVVEGNVMTMPEEALRAARARQVIVGGRLVKDEIAESASLGASGGVV